MITHQTGNLLDADLDAIVHQANLYHTFGGGIAKAIRERFPYAFAADLLTIYGSTEKLGSFSVGADFNGISPVSAPIVVNLYSQEGLSPSHTNYNAMYEGLVKVRAFLEAKNIGTVGFPYQMGCGLADGVWPIVKAVIEAAFDGSSVQVVIVKLPQV